MLQNGPTGLSLKCQRGRGGPERLPWAQKRPRGGRFSSGKGRPKGVKAARRPLFGRLGADGAPAGSKATKRCRFSSGKDPRKAAPKEAPRRPDPLSLKRHWDAGSRRGRRGLKGAGHRSEKGAKISSKTDHPPEFGMLKGGPGAGKAPVRSKEASKRPF